jgi:hypothetical protein
VEDADLKLPLEGALLQLWDGSAVECDDNGEAKINVPDTAAGIVLRVSYPGYDTFRLTIPKEGKSFVVSLRLSAGGQFEHTELLFEAERQGAAHTKTGRSISLPEKHLIMASEIGIIEDIMSSIKLLPGVGYTGLFNAMPSIRGGDPGDLTAILDGYYIENPYHWGGSYSIFDPKMVEMATLSHGVYSSRFGHTVSGVLDVASKKASNRYAEVELGISSSAFNFGLNFPIGRRDDDGKRSGGIALSGKITYWDGYVFAVQQLAKSVDILQPVNSVKTAPYIRSAGLSANFRWTNDLETIVNGYFGNDGVALEYKNHDPTAVLIGAANSDLQYSWNNTVGFFSMAAVYNPVSSTVLRATLGAGLWGFEYNADIIRVIPERGGARSITKDRITSPAYDAQGRIEYDRQIGGSLLLSVGIEEIMRTWNTTYSNTLRFDWLNPDPRYPGTYMNFPYYSPDSLNFGIFSAFWGILDWKPAGKKINIEFGARFDHLYFFNADFSKSTIPVISPRLNVDYDLLSNASYMKNVKLSAGTGLFSSLSSYVKSATTDTGLDDFALTKSWTSVIGGKIDLFGGWSVNIEIYYKYIFDRAYSELALLNKKLDPRLDSSVGVVYHFDGYGHVGGMDVMLQKFEGERVYGWISYSFNIARYRNPNGSRAFTGAAFPEDSDKWYYPEFHRFHTLNLVVNFKINSIFTFYTRTGFASGLPRIRHDIRQIEVVSPSTADNIPTTKFRDEAKYSDLNRNAFNIPLDMKLSLQFYKKNGKTQGEFYVAVENALVLLLPKFDNRTLNPYTGKLESGTDNPLYELPVPMGSFGFKWTY